MAEQPQAFHIGGGVGEANDRTLLVVGGLFHNSFHDLSEEECLSLVRSCQNFWLIWIRLTGKIPFWYFTAKLSRELAYVFGYKDIPYGNITSMRLISFIALQGISYMGKVYINFGVTYFENNDYQSWFIIATFPRNRGQNYYMYGKYHGATQRIWALILSSRTPMYLLLLALLILRRNSCPRRAVTQFSWSHPTPSASAAWDSTPSSIPQDFILAPIFSFSSSLFDPSSV